MKNIIELNVGDTAYIMSHSGAGQRHYKRVKVTKVTKTQIAVSDGTRYFRNDGCMFGERYKQRGWFRTLVAEAII